MGSKHEQAHRTSKECRDVKIEFEVQISPKIAIHINLHEYFEYLLESRTQRIQRNQKFKVLMYSVPEPKTKVLAGSEPYNYK
jgi:hypothetical protein